MSVKGIRQLKQLMIRYSDYDGSSKGIREWMQTRLVDFATQNPSLMIRTEVKRAVHPFLRGIYVNDNKKTICVKNLEVEDIHNYVFDLRNQAGYKVTKDRYKKPVISDHPSIQGEWHERMDLIDLDMEIKTIRQG
mmetsp:Transcript_15697/g.15834  ORF Transcript_15697/g.15834 Transcript_15697/m.15834 type:complete len:135 (+) Transcript_15697:54-458(+)